jgi:hypothetical protein
MKVKLATAFAAGFLAAVILGKSARLRSTIPADDPRDDFNDPTTICRLRFAGGSWRLSALFNGGLLERA